MKRLSDDAFHLLLTPVFLDVKMCIYLYDITWLLRNKLYDVSLYVFICICQRETVCMCKRENEIESERKRKWETERERENTVYVRHLYTDDAPPPSEHFKRKKTIYIMFDLLGRGCVRDIRQVLTTCLHTFFKFLIPRKQHYLNPNDKVISKCSNGKW